MMDSPELAPATAAAWNLAYLADRVIGFGKDPARAHERIEATRELLKAFEPAVNVAGRELERFRAVSDAVKIAGIVAPSWHDLALKFAAKVRFRTLPWGYEAGMDTESIPLDADAIGEAVADMESLDMEELYVNLLNADAKVICRAQTESKAPEAAPAPFVSTPLQSDILKALDGRALKKDPLAREVANGDDSRLYKPGGLNELRDAGKVDHKHGVGYFRPDKPPTCR